MQVTIQLRISEKHCADDSGVCQFLAVDSNRCQLFHVELNRDNCFIGYRGRTIPLRYVWCVDTFKPEAAIKGKSIRKA